MAKTKPKPTGEAVTSAQTIHLMRSQTTEGWTLDKRLPATYDSYRRIRRHPTVALARALAIAPVVSARWSIETDDDVGDEVVKFLQDWLMPARNLLVEQAMKARIDYGWAPFELVLGQRRTPDGIRIVPDRFKHLLVDRTEILVDRFTGEFDGFRQDPGQDESLWKRVEPDRAILINFDVEGDELYGEPLLENVRLSYQNWLDANKGAERYDAKIAGTHWVVMYPIGSSNVDGVETDNGTIAAQVLSALESSGSVSIPRKVAAFVSDLNDKTLGDAWSIDLKDHAAKQHSFVERLKYLDTNIVRGLLMPERSVLEGNFGTKAEAGEHVDQAMRIREIEHDRITDIVNRTAVARLVSLNFGDEMVGKVRLVASPLTDTNELFFREVYKLIMAHPVESIDAIRGIDIDALTDSVGLPKNEEVIGDDDDEEGAGIDRELTDRIAKLFKSAESGEADEPDRGGDKEQKDAA